MAGIDDKGDADRGDCREEHVMDVLEQGNLVHRRGQDGGVRHGRDLVSEISSRDDGASDKSVAEAFGLADAKECNTYGGDGGP